MSPMPLNLERYKEAVYASLLQGFPEAPKCKPILISNSSDEFHSAHQVVTEVCCKGGQFNSIFPGIDRHETLLQYNQRKRYWRKVQRTLLALPEEDLQILVDKVLEDGVLQQVGDLPDSALLKGNLAKNSKGSPIGRFSMLAKTVRDNISSASAAVTVVDVRATNYSLSRGLADGQLLVTGDVATTSVTLVNHGTVSTRFSVSHLHWLSDSGIRSPVLVKVTPNHGSIARGQEAKFQVTVNVARDTGTIEELIIVDIEGGGRIPLLISLQCCVPLFGSSIASLPVLSSSVACTTPEPSSTPGSDPNDASSSSNIEESLQVTIPLLLVRMVGYLTEIRWANAKEYSAQENAIDERLQVLKRVLETNGPFDQQDLPSTADIVSLVKLWLMMLPCPLLDELDNDQLESNPQCAIATLKPVNLGSFLVVLHLLKNVSNAMKEMKLGDEILEQFSQLLHSDASDMTTVLKRLIHDPPFSCSLDIL